jgi:hypothetical protein
LTLRRLGLGYNKFEKSPRQWTRDFIDYLHEWCHYRPLKELVRAYRNSGFTFESREIDYIRFRLSYQGRQWWIPAFESIEPLARRLLRRLASVVILSSKLPAGLRKD